jgi:hypothetical protein
MQSYNANRRNDAVIVVIKSVTGNAVLNARLVGEDRAVVSESIDPVRGFTQ